MSDPEVLKELVRWVRYAEDDLKVAELILDNDQVPRAACFNAQQRAEKSIKASLVFLQVPFPKTHDLNRLRDLLPEGWGCQGRVSRPETTVELGRRTSLPRRSCRGGA